MYLKTLPQWLDFISRLHSEVIELGLERIISVYSNLLRSEKAESNSKPLVITFAGTNGKGSTLALVESLALTDGKRVGAYTSPHFLKVNERFRLNGKDVPDKELIKALELVEENRKDIPLTYFEYLTLAAFTLFNQQGLDIWLLEVGLGGRLDAVNVVNPDIAVITTIDFDHQDWLGDDLEQIGLEKAGILRAKIPLVLGDTAIPKSIYDKAKELSNPVHAVGTDFSLNENRFYSADYTEKEPLNLPELPDLPSNNIATALKISMLAGIDINKIAEKSHFPKLSLKGRFQKVSISPEIVLDVAHNPHSAMCLSKWLTSNPVSGNSFAIFSALSDKDIDGVISNLAESFEQWHIFMLEGDRATPLDELRETINHRVAPQVSVCCHQNAREALSHLVQNSHENDRITVFGSFFTVAAIMETGLIDSLS